MAKKDPALEAAAASLNGKTFDLTEFEAKAAASQISQLRRTEQSFLLDLRHQVLQRIGVPAQLLAVAQVEMIARDGVPASVRIVEAFPRPPKQQMPPKGAMKMLSGGKRAAKK